MTTKPRVAAGASPPTALPRADISLSAIPSALWKLKRWLHELESDFDHLAAGLGLLASASNLLRQQANRPAPFTRPSHQNIHRVGLAFPNRRGRARVGGLGSQCAWRSRKSGSCRREKHQPTNFLCS